MSAAPHSGGTGIRVQGRVTLNGAPLFDADLGLGPAEWTCLLGPSGVGKSTLLRMIAGLETGATLDGTVSARAKDVAYMAQSDLLLPWLDVTGNVTLGARLRGDRPDMARARDLIARVGLADHSGKRPGQLSGGMRQRAALARTLMEDRPVILLDEPFSALDARTRTDMQDLAARLLTGRTVLLVTHDPAEAARMAHTILLMTPGRIESVAPPDTDPIRPFDDLGVFDCQSRLMHLIRAAA